MELTAEQLAARQHTLGASEVASAIGLNPYCSPHKLWLLKRGLIAPTESTRTKAGTLIEPIIAQMYCEETGAELGHFGTVTHPEHPWMSCTPDGVIFGQSRGLEVKLVGWRVALHWSSKEDGVPDYYRTQVEWSMAVTGAAEWDVAALIGGTDFRIYRIKRDLTMQRRLYNLARRFWFDHVLANVPPPVDGTAGAREMLNALFPRSVRPPIAKASAEAEDIAQALLAAKAKTKAGEAEVEALENKLRGVIGEHEGVYADEWKATWRTNSKGVRTLLFKTRENAA